jgi:hypothetical protein
MKTKRGRPRFKPAEADFNTVRTMAACGFTHEVIATCLGEKGIDKKTLYRYFRRELDIALANANTLIGSVAFQAAARGEAWAVCFWLKCRAGWTQTDRFEHSGPQGGPVEVSYVSATEQLRSGIARLASRKPAEPASSGD